MGLPRSFQERSHEILIGYLLAEIAFIILAVSYPGLSQYIPYVTLTVSVYVVFALIPFAVLAIHFDRQIVADRTEWTPSRVYYLIGVPVVFNLVLLVQYLYRRRTYIR